MKLRNLAALAALVATVGCSVGKPSSPSSLEPAEAPFSLEAPQPVSSSAYDPYLRQRHFSVRLEGRTIIARLSNPYDHVLAAGEMRDVWMSNFNRGSNPQGFISPGPGDEIGPRVVHEKETVEWSQEMPYGVCRIETEVYFGGGQRTTNGGPGGYNIGFGYIDIPGSDCHRPEPKDPECVERPPYVPDVFSPSDLKEDVNYCTSCPEGTFENQQGACQPIPTCETDESLCPPPIDVCLNLEGPQIEIPEGYYLGEDGCYPIPECEEEEWVEQEPVVTYGEWSECEPVLSASSISHPQCARTRTVRTVTSQVNSCTQAERVLNVESSVETEPCECPAPTCQLPSGFGSTCMAANTKCSDFGLVSVGTQAGSGQLLQAQQDASFVLVKSGVGIDAFKCGPGESRWRAYTNVDQGDLLVTPSPGQNISHAEYCGCPSD